MDPIADVKSVALTQNKYEKVLLTCAKENFSLYSFSQILHLFPDQNPCYISMSSTDMPFWSSFLAMNILTDTLLPVH